MKLFRWLFVSVLTLLLLVFGLLVLLQSRWTKDQLAQVLQEIALQAGVQLSIENIEGQLPLKWTFTNVHAKLDQGDTIDVDKLQVRIALFPLLRGHFGVSYLHADHTKIAYAPSTPPSSSPMKKMKGSFSLRSASFDEITLINRETKQEMSYNLTGRGRWLRGGKSFFVEGSLHSSAMDLNLFCEGSKRLDHLQTNLELSVKSKEAFAPFYTLPSEMAFELKTRSEGSWLTWQSIILGKKASSHKPISGVLDVQATLPRLDTFQLSSRFSLFPDRSWDLTHLDLLSPYIQLQGSAEITSEGFPKTLHTSVAVPDLSLFSSHLKGNATGKLDLHDEKCYLSLSTPEFTIDTTTFSQGKVELLAQIQKTVWTAAVEMEAYHPMLGYKATSELTWAPKNVFEIKSFDLISNIGRIAGDVTIYDLKNITGGLTFQIMDLAPLSELLTIPLAGQVGGEIQFGGDEVSARALGKHLKVNQFLSNRVDFDVSHVKFSKPFQGTLKMTSDEAYLREVYFTNFIYEMGWNTTNWNYLLQAKGDWKGPFDILTKGQLDFSFNKFALFCDELSGKVLDKHVVLQNKCHFEISKEAFKIDTLDLAIDFGHLTLASQRDHSTASLKMHAKHFPLDFLTIFSPRFSLKGLSSLDIDLEGTQDQLTGHLNILLEHADIYPAGSIKPIQTKGLFQAHVANSKLQLHTHLVATGEQLCEISATVPIHFELEPLQVMIPKNQPIAGQCTMEGYTEQLFDFINLGSQRVGGFLSTHLLLSGTLNAPMLHGPFSLQGGFYENYFIGIAVKDADITAEATGNKLIIEKALATDGEKGTSESTGVFHLRQGLPFFVEGVVDHFRVIRFDWLTGACSGPFTIEGNLGGALAKGKLTLDEADVTIPDQLPSDIPTLPITFINEPEAHLQKFRYSEPYPFRYDLDLHGDHDLRLSGRGIEAELEGDIHMTGKNLDVNATGALHTKKGKFAFAGKDFTINQGEILFSEEKSFLNITSTVEYPSLTVTVHFRGDLRSPQLIFESNPSLPTSSILARILFNKDVSELSAGQALQLANTIVTLSGNSGPNVLDSIRKSIGIDRLSFSADEETGVVSVQIGKYITRGVMISLTQSTENSQVKVEVEVGAGFVLEAETQAENQGKFSFKWNKNY